MLTSEELKPDSQKVKSLTELPNPADVSGIHRFVHMGFVKYLSKLVPNLSDMYELIRKLTLENS